MRSLGVAVVVCSLGVAVVVYLLMVIILFARGVDESTVRKSQCDVTTRRGWRLWSRDECGAGAAGGGAAGGCCLSLVSCSASFISKFNLKSIFMKLNSICC